MSVLSIRLSERLDANLNEESLLAGQPKSLIARTALEQFLADRCCLPHYSRRDFPVYF